MRIPFWLLRSVLFARQMKPLANAGRAKKTRLRQGGALIVENAHDIMAQKEVDEQIRRDKRSGEAFSKEGNLGVRRCGVCGKTGHNARTCQ